MVRSQHDVQDVAAADGVAGHHRDHRLGRAPDLHLKVEHVEPPHAVIVDVAVVAADLLVAARAERLVSRAGENDHTDAGSSRATLNAFESSNKVVGRNAFRTSGRFMVIFAMPSAVS
jgi:hypothetical protein